MKSFEVIIHIIREDLKFEIPCSDDVLRSKRIGIYSVNKTTQYGIMSKNERKHTYTTWKLTIPDNNTQIQTEQCRNKETMGHV